MDLPKTYQPDKYEDDIYALWEKSGVFTPKKASVKDSFSITMPPPNANANLHIGQALDFQLKDTIGRYVRSQGKQVLLLPGADHAGFESWYVYERKLQEQGKSKFDFSREELYRQVWEFVEQNRGGQEAQTRKLGIGADWTRYTYTLDDKVIKRAYETFKKMWKDGLVYRGERIVNYCTYHGTSFSDIEVVHEEKVGTMYKTAFPLADGSGEVVVASVRPETKLGQAALMVNPKDDRYKDLIGKEVLQPLVPDTPIKIVADEGVESEFGTGVVTVTPGHSEHDHQVALANNLEIKSLITHKGVMSEHVPEKYQGLTVEEARKAVAEDLENKGFNRGKEEYTHKVAVCYKCGTTIEPLLMKQWFVSMKPLAKKAIKQLEKNEIEVFPSKKLGEIKTYLGEIKDWNISRQIAWGIPIPVFQNVEDPDDWIYDTRVQQEAVEKDGKTYKRDPDVFDTWWSSGQWPYATLDYPSKDSDQFYPTSLMETGSDLLRQWVSRMILLGYYITGEPPFRQVYFHGMVVDEKGSKMSKSKGNVVNPMDILQEYGSDALRIGLLNGTSPGNPQPFGMPKIIGGRNFCNKLWNIARFAGESIDNAAADASSANTPADHWILSRLNQTITKTNGLMQSYRVSESYEAVHGFIWNDFADWYIEASKNDQNPELLRYVLESSLKLAHPFMPFVSEAIWQALHKGSDSLLASQAYPELQKHDQKLADEFESVKQVVSECRYIISVLKANKVTLYHKNSLILSNNAQNIAKLAKLEGVKAVEEGRGLNLTESIEGAWLDIDTSTAQAYAQQLKTNLQKQQQTIENLKGRLANKAYIAGAPKEIVKQTKQQLVESEQLAANIEVEISRFSS